jgi:hypothetical protein
MTAPVSDLLHAGTDSLRPSLPPAHAVRRAAERHRRIRLIAAVATTAVVAALIVAMGAGQLRDSATPPSPAQPGPDHSGRLLTLSPDLFTVFGSLPVRVGDPPPVLSGCVSSPLTWGAAESRTATYERPGHPGRVYNEFVLRYDTVAGAHSAVLHAWRQFRRCPTPPNVFTDPWDLPAAVPSAESTAMPNVKLSEQFANQRARFATAAERGQPLGMYALRVGRRDNIVVVIEDRGDPDDRAERVLRVAMSKAVRNP